MNERKFFDKPIRDITEICYPDKMTVDEFIIKIKRSLDVFKSDMNCNLESDNEMYVEQWAETYLAWMEIEND